MEARINELKPVTNRAGETLTHLIMVSVPAGIDISFMFNKDR